MNSEGNPEPTGTAEISGLVAAFETDLRGAATAEDVRNVVARVAGRKGTLAGLFKRLAALPPAERPAFGAAINGAKAKVEALAAARLGAIESEKLRRSMREVPVDVTLPPRGPRVGRLHPISATMQAVVDIFGALGFEVADGPEVEDDFHNFEALAFPPDHPARDMQDTLFVDRGGLLMRTHTSPVQIRTMLAKPPPVRIVCPGAVYRHDDDATHSPRFFQVEGLVVDEKTSFADLKGVLTVFVHSFFGTEFPVRFRPSFFPFTEPSAEMDCGCVVCGGKGCRVCKGTGWIEILGCGMVDPAVFGNVRYDPERFQGYAFGMGVDRLAMLRHGIDNIRAFYENDLRFLAQF